MKQLILVLLLSLLSLEGFSQDIVARIDYERRDPKPDFYEFSPEDGGLITFGAMSTRSTRHLGIYKYDANFKQQWLKNVVEQNGRKNVDFVTVIGKNILVFVSEFFPREKLIKTYYYQYNLQGEKIAEEAILSVYPNQKEQKVDLQYQLSSNKRQLLCYKNLQNRKEAEKILYYVFDETGAYAANGEIDLEFPDNRFKVRKVTISNDGNIYVLGKHYKTNRIRDLDDFQFLVYRHDVAKGETQQIPIELGDKYITDLAIKIGRDEDIFVAGFYSNQSTDRIVGTLLQRLNAEGEIVMNSSQEFSDEFLLNYLSAGQINRGRELKNFFLNNIILRSDGGVVLLAEKFYTTYNRTSNIYGSFVEQEILHYEDVIVTSISGTGEIEWHAIVDKNQVGESSATLSYFNAVGRRGSYVIYQDRPVRMDFNVYYNVVGIDGQVSKPKPLFKEYRYGDEFYPRFCEQVSNDEAVMVYFQNRGKLLSVIKIKLDK